MLKIIVCDEAAPRRSRLVIAIAFLLAFLLVDSGQQAWAAETGGAELRAESMPAQDAAVAQLSMGDVTAQAGGSVTVDVAISGNPGILGATLEVTYDSRLMLVNVSNGAAFQALDMTKPGSMQSGCKIHWDATDLADSDVKDGVVATLTFSVSSSAAAGSKCAVSVSPASVGGQADAYDRSLESVDLRPAACNVSVSSPAQPARVSLSSASVTVFPSFTFTGNPITPDPTVSVGGKALSKGSDYSVAYRNNVNAGTATVVVTGAGSYSGTKLATFKIAKASNRIAVKKASLKKSVTAKALKKKAATVALPRATATFGQIAWKVTQKDKKKVLSLSNGKVKVKKAAKKGVYTVKLKAKVAKTSNYGAATSKVVTVKVTVK